MLIQPDTNILVLKDCPLDKTYEHTLYFDSLSEQTAYFKGLRKHSLTKQSYQRYDKGVLHIQIPAESLYDCNYLMFQNAAFGTKWFYAFITSIEYVNNVSSKIKYELDVMQTWYGDYTVEECFVEREHSESDNIGDNIVPEHLDVGDFYLEELDVSGCPFEAGKYSVLVVQGTNKVGATDESGNVTYDCVVSNVFSGLDVTRYSSPSDAYDALKKLNENNQSDEVVGVFTVPSAFWGSGTTTDFSSASIIQNVSDGLSNPFNYGYSYVPKNNKVFTSPFFGLMCYSSSGANKQYAYEYFGDPENPSFGLTFSIGSTPEAVMNPRNYKGISGENLNESIYCTDFPMGSYATDTFRAYLAQNAGKITAGIGSTAVSVSSNLISNRPDVGSAISRVTHLLGSFRDASVLPDTIRGNRASCMSYTKNKVGFIFYKYKLREEYLRIIDGYFNMYGYATHRVKKPNISKRPHWNYVKTKGCVLTGSLPADDMAKIHSIYDNGITFWKNGSEVGVYSLDNRLT